MTDTVVMVTHGSAGDVLPFVRIGRELARRGCAVTLLTHAGFVRYAGAGVDIVAIDTEQSHRREVTRSTGLRTARRSAELDEFYRAGDLYGRTRGEVAALLHRHRPGRTVFVGRHTSAASVLFAGELTGAPTCWVAFAPAQVMVALVAAAHHRRSLAGGLDEVRARWGLPPVADWPAWFRSPSATIGLWPDWFDAAGSPSGPAVDRVGFVLADDLDPVAPGPDGPGPVLSGHGTVLVTGGTGRMLHPGFYPAALGALAAAGRPGLVVTPHRELLTGPLPAGVRWLPEVSFAKVMPACDAVVHHGGIGTAVRAMHSDTPQVILADGADRPDNARRLATHGLARAVVSAGAAGWDQPVVTAELAAVLAAPPGRWTPQRTAADIADGSRAAADRILALGRAGEPATGAPPEPADPRQELRRRLRELTPAQRRLLLDRLPRGADHGSGG